MKRWAVVTILLYAVLISLISVPLIQVVGPDYIADSLIELFLYYYLPTLVLIQAALLLIPVTHTHERPVGKRSVLVSAMFGAFPMGALLFFFLFAIIYLFTNDFAGDLLNVLFPSSIFLISVGFWILWGIIFYRNYQSDNPQAFSKTMTSWLLRGSILELLVAIPSHIIARQRDACCAPPITFLGIITGLSIALLSFGPGIYFLFLHKIHKKTG